MPQTDHEHRTSDYVRTTITNPWTFACGSVGAVALMVGLALTLTPDKETTSSKGTTSSKDHLVLSVHQAVGVGLIGLGCLLVVACLVVLAVKHELDRQR